MVSMRWGYITFSAGMFLTDTANGGRAQRVHMLYNSALAWNGGREDVSPEHILHQGETFPVFSYYVYTSKRATQA